jgi:hypothetical protein
MILTSTKALIMVLELYLNFYENLTLLNSYLGGFGAIVRINNVSRAIDHGFDNIWLQSGQISNKANFCLENFCLYNAYYTINLVNNYPTVTCLPQCPLECSSN